MKWAAAAAGVVVAGGLSLWVMAPREPARSPAPVPVPVAAAPAPSAAAAVPPPRIQPRTELAGVTLHGVLLRGAQSQALLSIDGRQQAYGVGDVVKPGWSVQSIREQQVVLGNGSTTTALEVAAPPPADATQRPATPAVAANAPARLPGFVAGAPSPESDAGARERNRRFLDAVRSKTHASQ